MAWESLFQQVPWDTHYLSLKTHTLAQMLVIAEHRTSNLYVQNVFWLRNPNSGTLKIGRDRTDATGKRRRLWKPNRKIVPNPWAIVQSIQPSFHLVKNQTVGRTDNSAAKTYWSKCSNLRPLSRVFLSSLPHKHSTLTHSQGIFWQWADLKHQPPLLRFSEN